MAYQVSVLDEASSNRARLEKQPSSVHFGQRFPRPRQPWSAEQVLKSFNTRAFKREKPGNPDLMLALIADAIARSEPVSFVLYWGKGFRPVLAAPEFACLDYIKSMTARISDIYEPGAKVTLVFTDTHAALNGHSRESIASYFEDLTAAARERHFETRLLSTLINESDVLPDGEFDSQVPPEQLLAALSASARKWFKGEGTAEDGAVRYFRANLLERKVIERAFSRSIFVTFNGSQLRSLFPDRMPIFYMFSLRHGVSDKPWFLPEHYSPDTARETAIEPEIA
jgi:hypothetical protein